MSGSPGDDFVASWFKPPAAILELLGISRATAASRTRFVRSALRMRWPCRLPAVAQSVSCAINSPARASDSNARALFPRAPGGLFHTGGDCSAAREIDRRARRWFPSAGVGSPAAHLVEPLAHLMLLAAICLAADSHEVRVGIAGPAVGISARAAGLRARLLGLQTRRSGRRPAY
jgi:hypothetical protein